MNAHFPENELARSEAYNIGKDYSSYKRVKSVFLCK